MPPPQPSVRVRDAGHGFDLGFDAPREEARVDEPIERRRRGSPSAHQRVEVGLDAVLERRGARAITPV